MKFKESDYDDSGFISTVEFKDFLISVRPSSFSYTGFYQLGL